MKLSHHILTRMAFDPADPQWPWRLAFYQVMALPRLLAQTCRDFEIWIKCHPEHFGVVAALDPSIKPCRSWEEVPRSHIQTRIDCDDLVGKGFVAQIHGVAGSDLSRPVIVSFQPYKLDLFTLRRYRMGLRYHDRLNSPFLSLYQPQIEGADYRCIYDYTHGRLAVDTGFRAVIIPEGYCDMVIHDHNKLNTIQKGDVPL
jgi:hypothetical protein